VRDVVRFVLDGEVRELRGVDPTTTVLNLLREDLRRTGTKEGCAEGDCGACTVALGELDGERVKWRAVNACILFAPMLDGKALKTVESLGGDHPVQTAMVEHHGSQCGFCTPGIVMSLWARGRDAEPPPVLDSLAGNLCRCTGYGPIIAAAKAAAATSAVEDDPVDALKFLAKDEPLALELNGRRWFSPRTLVQLADLVETHPDATILAGATDVGLWITKQHRSLPAIISINDVSELKTITRKDGEIRIGAGVRYADALATLAGLHPALGELVRRLGSVQVRNSGTIGGNIANGSPIGDMPPALIVIGAKLALRKGAATRELPLEDYFLDYGKQDRQPGEFIEAVIVPERPWRHGTVQSFIGAPVERPRRAPSQKSDIYKVSKRFDQDISAVCGAFWLWVDNAGFVIDARIAFGGMAAIPMRAKACEAALLGQRWTEATIETAAAAMTTDYQPIDDMRASAAYRMRVAQNMLRKLFAKPIEEPTNVLVWSSIDV
jgi:xanthine dehydrogenase small subunit